MRRKGGTGDNRSERFGNNHAEARIENRWKNIQYVYVYVYMYVYV